MSACLEITTVSHCKNVCSYCPQALLLRTYGKKEFLTLENFKICLSKVPRSVTISFAGYAEPFLNPSAGRMMAHAYAEGYEVGLYTTLVGLTKEQVDEIAHIRFANVQLHLPDNYNQMKADVNDEYIANAKYFLEKINVRGSHVYGPLHEKLEDVFYGAQRRNLDKDLHTRANNVPQEKIAVQHHPFLSGKIGCDVVLRRGNGSSLLDFNVLLPNGDVQICCLPTGSQILTSNLNYKNIENIKLGDTIVSHTGNIRKVTKLFERDIDEDIYLFRTANSCEIIKTTNNHPILIKSRESGKIRWLHPSKIQRLDYMVFPKQRPEPKTSIPKDLMWLYGLFLAEGYTDKNLNKSVFCLNTSEEIIAKKIENIVNKYYPNTKITINKYRKCNMDIHVLNKELAQYLFKHFGKYCDKKYISNFIMSAQSDELLELVKGHLDGDGCEESKRNRHITTSKQLAQQLYLIYLYNNIVPALFSSQQKKKKRYYELSISSNGNKMVTQDQDNFYFPIRKIEKEKYKGKVYNFDVEEDESYITNHITVHNCMDYGLEHTFGNLLRDSYESIFESEAYKYVQQALVDDTLPLLCRTCKEARQI